MTHKRNTNGLANAAKNRRENTIKKVNDAINHLMKNNEPVNFNSVSKAARVGKPWLYKETDVYNKIMSLRDNNYFKSIEKKELKQNISQNSKNNIIGMLKEKIKTIETENKKLKSQIEILYGKLCITKTEETGFS
jgi:hypothetical protein